ncbi:MAG: biosynthetic-type acetolactate synthase large subunit [Burkholderiales bacterium]|nr:biosynthetic-type acetolactate synthase large subunit [Burkholderiales bacterium]
MNLTGAQATIEALINEGTDFIFGYPGGAILPIYDALYQYREKIHHVLVRHEQGAAIAAEGYAKSSGKIGVCMATSGPGATNLVTGIADAMLDSVPLVCITGQVFSRLIGTDAFQEADIVGITIPVTKWNIQVTKAEDIPAAIAKAFYYAKDGRPGPVLVDITKDAQEGIFEYEGYQPHITRSNKAIKKHSDMEFIEIADILNNAKRPLIFAGNGVGISNAEGELLKLAEKANIPVACTLHGLHNFPAHHDLAAGLLGMHGNYAPNIMTNEADVILAVGMRFDDRVTGNLAKYAKQAKIIHIDVDHAEINKNVRCFMSVQADAKYALANIVRFVQPNKFHDEWKQRLQSLTEKEHEKVIVPELTTDGKVIRMSQAMTLVSEKTKGEAIVVPDVGQNQMIAMRYYKFQKPKSHISSGGLGTMGFALPAAIGAKIANPDREVICVSGDGGIQMNIQELAVIKQEQIPVKILLLNNNYLGMVRQWQELFYEERYSFVDLVNPDFVAVAQAYGIKARKVSNPDELEAAIDEMLASKEAYFLEVIVEKREKVFPMIPAGSAVDEVRLS